MPGVVRIGKVLVLGGGSEIALATVRRILTRGPTQVVLAARRPQELETEKLEAAGASVTRIAFDARATETHAGALGTVFDSGDDVDVVLVTFGVLGNQGECERNPAAAVAVAETNFVGAVSAMSVAHARLREQGHGAIVVLSSVAAQAARRSNYVYGASKAGLDAFARGLQLVTPETGVDVLIVRPGFVRTAMTRGRAPAPFAVSAEEVAEAIVEGLERGAGLIWVPPILRIVMPIVSHLPAQARRRL